MKDESLQIVILEKQILHAIMDNPSLIFEEDIFVSEQAKEFQYILLSLNDEGKQFIAEHILSKAIEYVNVDVVVAIQSTQYQPELFEDYKKSLYYKYILTNTREKLLNIVNSDNDDLSKIYGIEEEFQRARELAEFKGDDRNLTFSELVKLHKKTIEKRANQLRISTGCYKFDSIIPNPVAGIVTIAGFSGSTKSTLCHYLIKQRIAKRFYTTYFNTELALEGVMDSIIPSMVKIPYKDIMGLDNDDSHIDYSDIILKYNKLIKHFQNQKNFRMFPSSTVTLNDLKNFNIKARKDFGMKQDDLLFCFVDLLSMVEEFAGEGRNSRADMITQALNVLNKIALKYNILFICTVQLRRMPQKITIEKEEDFDRFRPDLNMIKDSGSYEERSRVVIGIHNPYHIARKVTCNSIIRELTEPIIELQVLKDTYTGKVGNIAKYYFNSEYKVYVPYNEDDTESSVSTTEDGLQSGKPYQTNLGGSNDEES